jgi:hypothetical protein
MAGNKVSQKMKFHVNVETIARTITEMDRLLDESGYKRKLQRSQPKTKAV